MLREKDSTAKIITKLLLCGVCAAVFVMVLLFAKPTLPPDQEQRDAQAGKNMPFDSLEEMTAFLDGALALPRFEDELSSFSAHLYFGDDEWLPEHLSALSAQYSFEGGSVCDLTVYLGREDAFDIPLDREYLRQNGLDICCTKTEEACALYFEADGNAYRVELRGRESRADELLARLLAGIEGFCGKNC